MAIELLYLTKKNIDALPFLKSGQKRYRDSKLTGFGLRVGRASKAYYAEKRVNGKTVRVTLGTHGQITPVQARSLAVEKLAQMTTGINPIEQKKAESVNTITLSEVFNDYKGEKKNLKAKTLYDYGRVMEVAFHQWRKLPILKITKNMVARKFKTLGDHHGPAYANLSMRLLRALFNFARIRYENNEGKSLIDDNPVTRISQGGGWYKIARRQSVISPQEIASWFEGVKTLINTTHRDYDPTLNMWTQS